MRTNIDIDDELLARAMATTGLTTKRATVEEGLRLLVRVSKQAKALADIKGLGWQGDLDQMRRAVIPAQDDPGRQLGLDRPPAWTDDTSDDEA